jgi:hypothetical protein
VCCVIVLEQYEGSRHPCDLPYDAWSPEPEPSREGHRRQHGEKGVLTTHLCTPQSHTNTHNSDTGLQHGGLSGVLCSTVECLLGFLLCEGRGSSGGVVGGSDVGPRGLADQEAALTHVARTQLIQTRRQALL